MRIEVGLASSLPMQGRNQAEVGVQCDVWQFFAIATSRFRCFQERSDGRRRAWIDENNFRIAGRKIFGHFGPDAGLRRAVEADLASKAT